MIAEREVQIRALGMEMTIDHFNSRILAIQQDAEDHWNAFSVDRQEAEAAVIAKVTSLERQIHALRQRDVDTVKICVSHT